MSKRILICYVTQTGDFIGLFELLLVGVLELWVVMVSDGRQFVFKFRTLGGDGVRWPSICIQIWKAFLAAGLVHIEHLLRTVLPCVIRPNFDQFWGFVSCPRHSNIKKM